MLSDTHRKLLHDLALRARGLLTQEARDVLESTFGLSADGRFTSAPSPLVGRDPDVAAVDRRLRAFLADEARAGLSPAEAADKLVREIAFTHLNRLAAFKMMEVRGLIRGTVDRGTDSNAFKLWLVDHPDEMARYEAEGPGDGPDAAYRRFLLWQAGRVARELAVLFDPEALPGLIFPRPRVLGDLLKLINDPALAPAWQVEEAVGWIYQFFNEEEKAQVFDRLYKQKQKLRRADIPAATQLFTPNWIVRFLVQNTLGRLWVEMHPDSRLVGGELMDYLVDEARPPAADGRQADGQPRRVAEITLLDPACGTMHFGLAAFDLLAAMYAEEIDRAGEPGWPETPSVADAAAIPAAILADNLFGIDIDLRAVQLGALALWLRAKRANPRAALRAANLACADVRPLNGDRLGAFLAEARFSPLTARLIGELWGVLGDADEVGSLLRPERALGEAIDRARRDYARQPLLARMDAGYGADATEGEAFWDVLAAQVEQGVDEFARAHGDEARFFAGEAHKGIRLLALLGRRYDVVVANPPYSGKRNLNDTLAGYLDRHYPSGKGDLYTAFIQRCAELADERGRVGMITQQSFMFLSSFEALRAELRQRFAVESMAHVGPRAFAEIGGEKVNTVAFTLRGEPDRDRREASAGAYFRLVNAPEADGKRRAFERALAERRDTYRVAQSKFDAIPGAPWVYWVSDGIRELFRTLPSLGEVAQPRQGLATADNFRFLRFWWEVGAGRVAFGCPDAAAAQATGKRWFPYMKGGEFRRWSGNQEYVVNWKFDGQEIRNLPGDGGRIASRPQNTEYYFREGLTWTDIGTKGFAARLNPGGFLFDVSGSCAFPLQPGQTFGLIGLLNGSVARYLLGLLNPTVHFQVGDLARLPIVDTTPKDFDADVIQSIQLALYHAMQIEMTFDFVAPTCWQMDLRELSDLLERQAALERRIKDRSSDLYRLDRQDFSAIETEMRGATEEAHDSQAEDAADAEPVARPSSLVTEEALAVRWISYAVGIVLGRFAPGQAGALGRAVYRREDFAVGSLPAPDEAEFDRLVGPAARFAYTDEAGRHVFPAAVEAALRRLALPDGIAVLDPGHPRDLTALVERALELMLGEVGLLAVVRAGAGGDLRRFLGREFFTRHHFSWYRKRPVYWPLQTAGRAFGLVVFHERVGEEFLYVVLRDYLDQKTRALELALADARGRAERSSGAARRAAEREAQSANGQLLEVDEFAATVKRLADAGYRPRPDWIDDGVLLRLAPLHELLPLWRAEPKKAWERLARGDFDWSHIALAYWPARVRQKCRTNKSLALAHGLLPDS